MRLLVLVGSRLGRPDCLWLQETTMVGDNHCLWGVTMEDVGATMAGGHRGGGRLLERAAWWSWWWWWWWGVTVVRQCELADFQVFWQDG